MNFPLQSFLCYSFFFILIFFAGCPAFAQNPPHSQESVFSLSGRVVSATSGQALVGAYLNLQPGNLVAESDKKGRFRFNNLSPGSYKLMAFADGMKTLSRDLVLKGNTELSIEMDSLNYEMEAVDIIGRQDDAFGMGRLKSVEGTAIYAGKKTEVILVDKIPANLATNSSRQIYSRVAGLNIWESDGAGLQLGIGGRGLNPNRTSNFNVRQNGYDISADALGYPESYYTPPAEAVERIELVRGAASLQYGTQFGGMLNFSLKRGNPKKKFEIVSRETIGSFGLISLFNSIGGQVGKVNYYAFYQHKNGNGWRANSEFAANTVYGAVRYQVHPRVCIGLEYTRMQYLARQAGGLTDAMFQTDPRQSIRERNWFRVTWNVAALTLDYKISDRLLLNLRNFGLIARRQALGYLGRADRSDPLGNRDLIDGKFRNFGNETRLIYKYDLLQNPSAFLVGARFYMGNTLSSQGQASEGQNADFTLLNPDNPEGSDYLFPSANIAVFAENVFNFTSKLSFTPGVRFEYIRTASEGYYTHREYDLAGNLIFEQTQDEKKSSSRAFVLLGAGLSYKFNKAIETYGNFSQNYRAINFNDLRIINPSLVIDPNLKDEKGFNAELGMRGSWKQFFTYDLSLFYLQYKDRIGEMLDGTVRLRTNLANSRSYGLEAFAEANLVQAIFQRKTDLGIAVFGNFSFIRATYYKALVSPVEGKLVELVPPVLLKSGLSLTFKGFRAAFQYTYTAKHFSDASNAESYASGVIGSIPAYDVMDLSFSYGYKFLRLETSINNLANRMYFTRRASGYPGPGILPSDGRSYFVTLQIKI